MTTRLLALALAAAGLSAGGFQLGARQAPTAPPEPVLDRLPADHVLSVALQEPTTRVTQSERERLKKLAREMEVQRKEAETARVRALDKQIQELQRKLMAQEVRLTEEQLKLALKHPKTLSKTAPPKTKSQIKDIEVQVKKVRERLVVSERARARSTVERKFEGLMIETLRPEVRGRVFSEVRAIRAEESERGFALLIALRERDSLKLTPRQVTQLQLLQSDFIRRFAPLREESETTAVIEVRGAAFAVETIDSKGKAAPNQTVTLAAKGVELKGGEVELRGEVTEVREVPVLGQLPIVGRLFKVETQGKPFAVDLTWIKEEPSKKIEALKNEIDDKAYEILNDDQQKRLRRLVAISLSGPQP